MPLHSEEIDDRLRFLMELLSVHSNYYFWTYDSDGTLMDTNCRDLVLEQFFRGSGCYDYMMEHMEYAAGSAKPLLMSSVLSMVWGAVFEMDDGHLSRIHVLGPAFTQTVTQVELEKQVLGKIPPRWKPKYLRIMEKLPVLSSTTFFHRILMLHYCVTGEHIQISDIVMQREEKDLGPNHQQDNGVYADRIQVYMAEQSLLQMIRNGDLNYQDAMRRAALFFSGNQRLSGDPLQHAKLGQVQFVALCCNAAIDGGLSAEAAYNRKDAYIQDIDNAKSISEITEIGQTMYVDYITLVRKQRTNPAYCKAVQSTCDYMESHLDQNLPVETLASRVGYSGYYLSRLFKKETGFSVDEYARNVKIERAKLMLASTQDSIQDISDALGFGDRNYFSTTFRNITGIPPAAYRKKHQKL